MSGLTMLRTKFTSKHSFTMIDRKPDNARPNSPVPSPARAGKISAFANRLVVPEIDSCPTSAPLPLPSWPFKI